MVYMKDICLTILKSEDCEKFFEFASQGKLDRDKDGPLEFMMAWNQNHGHDLMLVPGGIICEDMRKMIDYWKSTTHKKKKTAKKQK